MPHFVNFFIDGGVFGNIRVRLWNVGLRLVVVVVGDEVLHRVFGKQSLEFPIKLGRQCFIGSNHQGRLLDLGYGVCHGKSLARTGDPQQHLVLEAALQPIDQNVYG